MTRVRFGGVIVALAVATIVLAGCRVDTRTEITVNANGSGTVRTTVTLDAEAVNRLGGAGALTSGIPLGDLRAAGWTISPWTSSTAGGELVTFEHPFVDQRDLVARLTELTGPNGVLRDPRITRHHSLFESKDAFSVVVDLRSPSAAILDDSELASRLRAAGLDPAVLQTQLSSELKAALHLSVVVHLPGGVTRSVDATGGTLTTLTASHGGTDWDRVIKLGIALVLALIAGMLVLAASVSARRNRRRQRERVQRTRVEPERTPLM